jgi:PAP2 superfamily
LSDGIPVDVAERSLNHGRAVSSHVLSWSQTDGGARIENMGFPETYALGEGPATWKPTNTIAQQQTPLLPKWGQNRSFAMPAGNSCNLPPPPAYSEDKTSDFYKEALEVRDVTRALSLEHKAIARFWSDDPMMSPTPPGHWIAIALQVMTREKLSLRDSVDVLARLGVAIADGFIGCWQTKYEYDLLRPVTYIQRVIDKTWQPLLITPPFPEYPSGHSTQSGAAAAVLAASFGKNYAFEDSTHARDGLAPRKFASFEDAAKEAAMSRLYGGIHFRSAVDRGLDQGKCIGAFAVGLKTLK